MIIHLSPLVIFILWCFYTKTGQQTAGALLAFGVFVGALVLPGAVAALIIYGLISLL